MSTETKTNLPIFKTNDMQIGDTVKVVLTSVKETNYGLSYRGLVNGVDSYINFSGNLAKFLPKDLAEGRKELNTEYDLTRRENRKGVSQTTGKPYEAGNFTLYPSAVTAATNAIANAVGNVTAVKNPVTSTADKLAAIRANRGKSTSNG